MNDFFDCSHHGKWFVALENIAAHVYSRGSTLYGIIAEFK
eukprot:COSAG01_NODE_64326_length_277_cov_0.561798_1_plen_39_part_10